MKSVRSLLLFIYAAISVTVSGFAAENPPGAKALSGPAQHTAASRVAPMSLPQVLDAAQENNPDIHSALKRVIVGEAKAPGAGALDDPMVMYRDWGTPLRQPWNLNQAQNMLMVQQTFPGFGKRAARSQVAGKEIEVAKVEVEAVRREVAVRVRKAFLDLLRSSDDSRIHNTQVRLTREALSSAQVKYTVGKAPQQDVLKAQIALTKLAEHLIGISAKQIEGAGANRAQAAVPTITMYSTAEGSVVERKVTRGQYVNAGDTLFTVADLSTVWVKADVYESQLAEVKAGQAVEITSEALPNKTIHGQVEFIEPTANAQTRTVPVHVHVANPGMRLRPGMFVRTKFVSRGERETLLVPRSAVLDTGTRKLVYVAKADGIFESREVEVGAPSEDAYPVLRGSKKARKWSRQETS